MALAYRKSLPRIILCNQCSILGMPCRAKWRRWSGLLKRRSAWQQAPHPILVKSVVPVGRGSAQPAPRSLPLFWGGGGERKKTVEKPLGSGGAEDFCKQKERMVESAF